MQVPMLQIENLSVRYGQLDILQDVSFSVRPRQWLMVVGPNGAGKSTLVNAVTQGVPYTGTALFHGQNIAKLKPAQRARNMGMLMQSHHVGYSFTVEEVVRLGRYAYSGGLFSAPGEEDEQKIDAALRDTGMLPLRRQSVLTLSGGELQRTFLAQVLAQDPKMLILDEPANHLDLVYQKMVFELVEQWTNREERAVISVVHDLSLARAFGTHALLLDKGRIISRGAVAEVLRDDHLDKVYGMDVAGWMRQMLCQWQPAEPQQKSKAI